MPLYNMSDRLPCFACCVAGTIHGRFFEVQAGYKLSVNSGKKAVLPFEAGYLGVYSTYVSFQYALFIVWTLGRKNELFEKPTIERFHSLDQHYVNFLEQKKMFT